MADTLPISFGPYADAPPPDRLIGQGVRELERSRLFEATGARMRRMVGADRVYVSERTDFMLHTAEGQRVVAITATLLPPDLDGPDDVFGFKARRDDEEIPLGYGWALLLQIAHEVLALPALGAVRLLDGLYQEDYLPRDEGDLHLALIAGKRFQSGDRALCLLAGLKDGDG